MLVVALALQAPAADTSQEGTAPKPNAMPVSELLERMSKSPLEPGEAGLLRAVAELIDKEKEHVTRDNGSAAVQAAPRMPVPKVGPTAQRTRLVIRLRNAPAIQVAKTLESFFDSQTKVQRACEDFPDPKRAIFIPEPVSNCLLVSLPPRIVDEVTKLIENLDARPPMVEVDLCIAQLLPPSRKAEKDDELPDDPAVKKARSMEKDGAAWLAWAKEHGRLEVLSRPRIMTLDNQRAVIKIGGVVPSGAPAVGTDSSGKGHRIERTEVGQTVTVTPRISPEGLVLVELDVERAAVVNRDGASDPTRQKTTIQTSVWTKDGQTTVLPGLIEHGEDGYRQMIVAVTPRVNPKRRFAPDTGFECVASPEEESMMAPRLGPAR
jgi:type II secretory pathway component GspD/PulD (secretin)